jgi:putative membrane protein
MMNGMFGGMWFFGIVLIVFIVWVITQFINKNQQSNFPNMVEKETPMDILKKRYSKGELTKDEFEEMKKDLL